MASGKKKGDGKSKKAKAAEEQAARQAEEQDASLPRVESVKLANEPVDTRLNVIHRFPSLEDEGEAPEPPPKPNTHYVLRQWSPRPSAKKAPSLGSMDPSRRKK